MHHVRRHDRNWEALNSMDEALLPRGRNKWTDAISLIQKLEKLQNAPKSRKFKTKA